MSKQATEHVFTGTTSAYPASYNSANTSLGKLIKQYTGAGNTDKYAGPLRLAVARPMEQSTSISLAYPSVHTWSSTLDYILLCDNAAAAATRRFVMYEFDKSSSTFSWRGFITVTFPTATNHTIRGAKLLVDTYSTGTVSVSGTAVTGSGTAWQTARFAVGARIGFGSTDPTQITTWYEISAIGSDTSITLTYSAGTIGAGTAFVIEEMRIAVVTTNATAANGGLFLVKGLNPTTFQVAGTNIAAATTTDNIPACFWIADASTVTNTAAAGIDIDDKVDNTNQVAYVLDGASTTAKIFTYNIRGALTLASGKATNVFNFATGNQTVTGNIRQNNNGVIWTAGHGPGSGVKSFYFVTASRIYRAAVSGITNDSTTFVNDAMTEVPPGGTNTFAATGAISTLDYDDITDRLVVLTTGATGARSYITQYNTVGSQMESIFLVDTRQLDQSTNDSNAPIHPNHLSSVISLWISDEGLAYLIRNNTATASNQLYVMPLGAHWTTAFTSDNLLITPAMSTQGCTAFYRAYVNSSRVVGGGELAIGTEPYRVYYRTSGISDDSGNWNLLDSSGNLSGVAPANQIQFAFTFKTAGLACIPARIHSVTVLYENSDSIPAALEWNYSDSSSSTGTVGFAQIASFGGSVPTLTIEYRRSDNNTLVLTQASTGSTNGTFEYHNGSTWVSGTGTDTIGLRRRFVPGNGILPGGVDLYMKIIAL
jgi:hypothetical protein